MPQLFPRLFSDDGVDSSFSRCQPHTIYYPDASTIDSIKFLFSTLQQLQIHQQKSTSTSINSSNYNSNNNCSSSGMASNNTTIDIQDFPFLADLSLLAPDDTTKLITVDDVCLYVYIMCVYVCMYVCMYACIYDCMYVCVYLYVYLNMYV